LPFAALETGGRRTRVRARPAVSTRPPPDIGPEPWSMGRPRTVAREASWSAPRRRGAFDDVAARSAIGIAPLNNHERTTAVRAQPTVSSRPPPDRRPAP